MSDDAAKSAAERELAIVLARKAQGRRDIARRSFGEKIAMMEALRERLAPFKRERERRRAARAARVAVAVSAASLHADDGGETEGSASATSAGSNT